MEQDILSDFCITNPKKTYSKHPKTVVNMAENPGAPEYKRKPLTTKNAMKYLLEGRLKRLVCRYCLNVAPLLSELDQIMHVAGTGTMYKVTIRDMVASFHPVQVMEDQNLPDKICNKCLNLAISSYLFRQQCERAERALRNCLDDMFNKLEKLDPLERPKKRGRQKLKPNYNVLHAEHYKVIDYAEPIINIVNLGAESMTTEPEMTDLECKRCWQVLPNVESLLNHEKTHPNTMWFHCRLCGKSFPKRNQLKQHYHRVHVLGKEPKVSVANDFKCNECGQINNDYKHHLQHMEKHKFKCIMEHVVEKKMDQLCMVCLDKCPGLVDIDKMVGIHGGYPELTGDKTLQTILASTLPDHKSYKYQDLCIPEYAKIMKIVKRNKSIGKAANNGSMFDKTVEVHDFVLANPIIITAENIEIADLYMFIFSEPEAPINYNNVYSSQCLELKDSPQHNSFEESTNKEVLLKISDIPMLEHVNLAKDHQVINFNFEMKSIIHSRTVKPTDVNAEIENLNTVNEEGDKNETATTEEYTTSFDLDGEPVIKKYKFSKPNMNIDIKFEETSVKKNLCEKCWIFNNANCTKCKANKNDLTTSEKIIDINNKNDTDTSTRDMGVCKFCWIFKHSDKCDYCKQPIVKVSSNNANVTTDDTDINNGVTYTLATDLTNSGTTNKNLDLTQLKIQKCIICLANNSDSEHPCSCLDLKLDENPFNPQLSINNNSLVSKSENKVSNEITFNEDGTVNDFKTTFLNSKHDSNNQSHLMSLLKDMDESKNLQKFENQRWTISNAGMFSLMKDVTSTNFKQPNDTLNEGVINFNTATTENMDIENNLSNEIPSSFVTDDFEQMDVDDSTIPDTYPAICPPTNQIMASPNYGNLHFNIGSGDQGKGVRGKRPLRNMFKAFHK